MKLTFFKSFSFSFKSKPFIINRNSSNVSEQLKKQSEFENQSNINSNKTDESIQTDLTLLKYLSKEKTILKSKQCLLDFIKNKNVLILFPYPCKLSSL